MRFANKQHVATSGCYVVLWTDSFDERLFGSDGADSYSDADPSVLTVLNDQRFHCIQNEAPDEAEACF